MRNFVVKYKVVAEGEVTIPAKDEDDAKKRVADLSLDDLRVEDADLFVVEVTDARVLDQED